LKARAPLSKSAHLPPSNTTGGLWFRLRSKTAPLMQHIIAAKDSGTWPAATVEIWPLERLTANPHNARIHGPQQIEQIRASLREFGWTMPVLVRENGMLIAGHGRLEAAKLEGITEVPTIVARGWTEAQCQAYAICDNKLTEASHWDEELLRLELGDLREAGFNLTLTGFDQDELDRLLVVDRDLDGDPDNAPEPPAEPISKPGDLWVCAVRSDR
jgi:ParB-like chromosome segregation protein Spo0J